MVLLDSSAILAYLWAEPGWEVVQARLDDGPSGCPVVNWSEVAAKVLSRGGDWPAAEAALIGQGLEIVPAETEDAVTAARLWLGHSALSLGDRLCLAVSIRLDAEVVTADQAWLQVSPRVSLIRR